MPKDMGLKKSHNVFTQFLIDDLLQWKTAFFFFSDIETNFDIVRLLN